MGCYILFLWLLLNFGGRGWMAGWGFMKDENGGRVGEGAGCLCCWCCGLWLCVGGFLDGLAGLAVVGRFVAVPWVGSWSSEQ